MNILLFAPLVFAGSPVTPMNFPGGISYISAALKNA